MSSAPVNPALVDPAADTKKGGAEYFWLWVLCVLGLDYFSTLAYQPSITFHETARLGPLATAAVVLVTLFGALPVYCYLAGRSPGGQGSLGIVEKLVRGWRGKTIVLILLGFAATDFTMLKSLSLADASVHVLTKHDRARTEAARLAALWCKDCARDWINEDAARHVDEQLLVTIALGLIAFAFWFLLRKGFNRNVMILAVPLVALYVLLTAILVGGGIWMLWQRPEIVADWLAQLESGQFAGQGGKASEGWGYVILLSLLALPNLALGLSGFEMSMILMPQVQGKTGEQPPRTRIWNTRKVLVAAAVIMSILLLGSVLVTTLLIPPSAFVRGPGSANDRALSYLAHGEPLGQLMLDGKVAAIDEPILPFCGPAFGLVYDIVTVLILCLAGTSVMTALGALIPMFMLRFGMELRWASRWGVMLMLFAGVNVLVTVLFDAHVEDQRGAYATGVLVLIACAAVVTVFDKRREAQETRGFLSLLDIAYYSAVALVLVTTMLAVAMRSSSGLGIAFCFIAAILAISIVSRAWRADELRTIGFEFKDEQSRFMWDSLRLMDFPVLVPLRTEKENHDATEQRIRAEHSLSDDADVVFVEVNVDDPSDFFQDLLIEVVRDNNRYIIRATRGVSVPHALAAVALEMSRHSKPPGLHFAWPERDLFSASWSYLAFGVGNIPWKVRELIKRAEKDPAKRPRVIVG
ncbi:MAG TPA: amino acid transporter [Gemmataceae bacterium]|nr:amino acid transporter [Gemmataceae bacterium]